ncbi:MAG: DNA polymerase III subunit gamma/tau [Chloroflexota bacterium]|nr:DNA polymerase III subunit gamma/tau [Chloroflexota bacterium]
MSEKVLYRKWRPLTFNEVVGQEHVTKTLTNSIEHKQTSHAYLFTGPRGVGKTTMARVLAKAVNCVNAPNCCLQPIGERNFCDNCISINSGSMIDLIEIDAASNRSIDDIRDIKEKSLFAPNIGTKKVYIIDEAHGLTGPAQQAFLKLLEEPPENVIIILATTEISSIPQTIISRCQRFDFNRINLNQMSSHLKLISDSEKISISLEACKAIALNSSGSLRDAENILQQISTLKNKLVEDEDIFEFLGLSRINTGIEILNKILNKESNEVLKIVHQESVSGTDPLHLKNQVLKCLRGAIYIKNGLNNLLEESESTINALSEISKKFSIERLNKISKVLVNSKIENNEFPPISLEVAFVECCELVEANKAGNLETEVIKKNGHILKDQNLPKPPEKKKILSSVPQTNTNGIQKPAAQNDKSKVSVNNLVNTQWKSVCKSLNRVKGKDYFIGALLHSVKPNIENGKINLIFKSNTLKQNFLNEISNLETKQKVLDSIKNIYNESLELIVDESVDSSIKEQNPLVKTPIVQHAISMGAKIKKTD